ncbi:MAG: lysophospholipid acyltransferase family protein, partial [Alphaproteobacteria bacterium]
MRVHKRILRHPVVRWLFCFLCAQYIRLVFATSRWQTANRHIPQAFWERREPFVLCFWHGRLLMMPKIWPAGPTIHILISSHIDGQFIAQTIRRLGMETIAGSSTRGGAAGLRRMLQALKAGDSIGISPDGPRGPARRVTDGTLTLARLSGAALVPAAVAVGRRRLLPTWDSFQMAFPFSRAAFAWGEPLRIPRDASAETLEEARRDLEQRITAATADADRLAGLTPAAPAGAHN